MLLSRRASDGRYGDRECALALGSLAQCGIESENADVRRFVANSLASYVKPEKGVPVFGSIAATGLAVIAESHNVVSSDDERLFRRTLTWLSNDDLDYRLRAYVPRVVGSFAKDAARANIVLDALLKANKSEKRAEVRLAIVDALGRLPLDEEAAPKAIKALTEAAKSGSQEAKRIALLGLGRRAAHPGGEAAQKYLHRQAKRPTGWKGPWIALAFGLWGHEQVEMGETPSVDRLRGMRVAMRKSANPDIAVTWALALGLSQDAEAAKVIGEAYSESSHANLGLYAIALGMCGGVERLDALRQDSKKHEHDAPLLEDLVIARALLGDQQLAKDLALEMDEACCDQSAAAYARALARVPDRRVAGLLAERLAQPKASDYVRAWSAMALGRLADDTASSWTSAWRSGFAWPAKDGLFSSTDKTGFLDR